MYLRASTGIFGQHGQWSSGSSPPAIEEMEFSTGRDK